MAEQAIAPAEPPAGFLALMRNRNYALLWWSQAISQIGDRFHWIAISLWIYSQTGSALSVSYAIIALMIGPVTLGLLAGVLADRWNKKWTMILSDLLRAGLVALIPWLMAVDIKLVYLTLFLVSSASAFFRPAMLATIQQSVPKKDLMPANSFFMSMDTGSEIIGPLLAGVVISRTGYALALYLDSLSYVISGTLLVLTSLKGKSILSSTLKIFADLEEGFLFIRRDKLQLALLMLIFFGWWLAGFNSLQTPLTKGVLSLSDQEFGTFNAFMGTGFLAGSFLMGWYGKRLPRGGTILFSFFGWIGATGLAGLSASVVSVYTSAFLFGFWNMILVVALATTLMEITPADKFGRVLAARQFGLSIVRTVAMLAFGVLADAIGVRRAIVAMASTALVGLGLEMILFPSLITLGRDVGPTDLSVQKRKLNLPAALYRFLVRILIVPTDHAYERSPQRVLNAVCTMGVMVAWILILLSNLPLAIFLAGSGATMAGLKLIWRASRRRGSKNMRGIPLGRAREEFGGRGRKDTVTGPTASG